MNELTIGWRRTPRENHPAKECNEDQLQALVGELSKNKRGFPTRQPRVAAGEALAPLADLDLLDWVQPAGEGWTLAGEPSRLLHEAVRKELNWCLFVLGRVGGGSVPGCLHADLPRSWPCSSSCMNDTRGLTTLMSRPLHDLNFPLSTSAIDNERPEHARWNRGAKAARRSQAQTPQYPLIEEYSFSHNRKPRKGLGFRVLGSGFRV